MGDERAKAAADGGAAPRAKGKGRIPVFDSMWKQRIGLYGGILIVLIIAATIPRIYNESKAIELAVPAGNAAYAGPSYLYAAEKSPERSATFPLMYAMADGRWSSEAAGPTGYTIGEAGSLVCALAYDQPEERLPSQINQAMMEAGAYTDTGGILWDKVNECVAPMRYTEYREADANLVIDSLAQGKSALVMVADGKNMALWLWVAGTEDGDYVVYNPTKANGLPERLSSHGRVYAVVVGEMMG